MCQALCKAFFFLVASHLILSAIPRLGSFAVQITGDEGSET